MPGPSDAGARIALAALVTYAMPGGVPGVSLAPPPGLTLPDSRFRTGGRSVMATVKAVAGVGLYTVGVPRIPAHVSAQVPGRTWIGRTCIGWTSTIVARIPGLNLPHIVPLAAILPGVVSLAAILPGVVHYSAILPAAFRPYVGIKLVGFPCTAGNIAPQGLGFLAALLGFLPQPGRVYLRLLRVGTRPDGLGLPFTRINFHVLGFAPDLGGLFPVLLVPLLLHCFPAPSTGQEQQHNQHHNNNGNYHPYPWSCVHVSHHFPLRCDRAGLRHSG